MTNLHRQIIETLIKLKNDFDAIAIKTEFEAEGASFEETKQLKDFLEIANLDLSVKIGGCEAIRDIKESKILAAKNIIAPMIESPFALQKFSNSIDKYFEPAEIEKTNFLINIETITGVENFKKIINTKSCEKINGIILGREDLVASMGLAPENINSEKILAIAKEIGEKCANFNKKLTIGGGICEKSIDFLRQLSPYLSNFETRKVVFNASILQNKNIKEAINLAIQFEIMWLEYKQNILHETHKQIKQRILTLKNRLSI